MHASCHPISTFQIGEPAISPFILSTSLHQHPATLVTLLFCIVSVALSAEFLFVQVDPAMFLNVRSRGHKTHALGTPASCHLHSRLPLWWSSSWYPSWSSPSWWWSSPWWCSSWWSWWSWSRCPLAMLNPCSFPQLPPLCPRLFGSLHLVNQRETHVPLTRLELRRCAASSEDFRCPLRALPASERLSRHAARMPSAGCRLPL